jgi:predicted small integral membrane protein
MWRPIVSIKVRFGDIPTETGGLLTFRAAIVLWLGRFLGIGGAWFLMWPSSTWNGPQAATRMFIVTTLTQLLIAPDEDR